MSHQGEGHEATPGITPGVPSVMTFGAPAAGDIFADRYRLDEHVDTDSTGRQIWRGTDAVLRRPVAIVVRQPGGEAAAGMLTAAVAASQLVHPHIVSVYDAIDEGERAYIVREWVPGVSLLEVLRAAPLDAERSTLVTHAIAEAVAALHGAGIVHGNVHPGTILIADDGRVVLTDASGDAPGDPEIDIRALGGVLYACLTSHWPYEAGRSSLPDALRDSAGRLVSPRQVRGGIPNYLDEIASELLDLRSTPPPAAALAADFARLATQGADIDYDDGPIGFNESDSPSGRRFVGGKLTVGIAVLAAIAVAGAFAAIKVLGTSSDPSAQNSPGTASLSPGVSPSFGGTRIPITANQVRIVDPPQTNRSEVRNAALVVDGDTATGWSTDTYNRPYLGGSKAGQGLKPGMGILIDLGAPTKVGAVKVLVNQKGASIGLRTGTSDPGATVQGDAAKARAADSQIAKDFVAVGQPFEDYSGLAMVFPVPPDQQTARYLLVWVTKLPDNGKGGFSLTINEITVLTP